MNRRTFALTIVGGRGERLKPLTDTVPKSMIDIGGRPLIAYQINWMLSQGITDVVFLCGYKGEVIKDYFGDGKRFGFNAYYSFEKEPLGRGGAIKKGMKILPEGVGTILVTNGDNVTNQPLSELYELHVSLNVVATMMLVPFRSQYGVVEISKSGLVEKFVEKGNLPLWINAGVYLFDRSISTRLPDVGDHETSTFPELARQNSLAAIKSRSTWLTIDTSKDISNCQALLKSMGMSAVGNV